MQGQTYQSKMRPWFLGYPNGDPSMKCDGIRTYGRTMPLIIQRRPSSQCRNTFKGLPKQSPNIKFKNDIEREWLPLRTYLPLVWHRRNIRLDHTDTIKKNNHQQSAKKPREREDTKMASWNRLLFHYLKHNRHGSSTKSGWRNTNRHGRREMTCHFFPPEQRTKPRQFPQILRRRPSTCPPRKIARSNKRMRSSTPQGFG